MIIPEAPEGYEVEVVPLHSVGHDRSEVGVKDYGDGKVTEFFRADEGQMVLAFGEEGPVWAEVAGFSEHTGVEVVVVDLDNGLQIITDHDPRAVFGRAPGEDKPRRFYPDEALALGVLVPYTPGDGLTPWGGGGLTEEFDTLWEALDRRNLLWSIGEIARLFRSKSGWALESVVFTPTDHLPYLEGFSWAKVVGAHYTGIRETGYDLTVPGFETFMTADGVVLSNTMAVHVPSLPEAVKDAKEKILPSKMLFSIRNRDKTIPTPKHESLLGLYAAQQNPVKDPVSVGSAEEALELAASGKLDIGDTVEIPDRSSL